MSFMRTHGWYCQFLEDDLQTSLPTTLNFATSEKVIELIERGGGFTDSESRNTVADAIGMGRGGVYLSLTDEQYRKLAPSHP